MYACLSSYMKMHICMYMYMYLGDSVLKRNPSPILPASQA